MAFKYVGFRNQVPSSQNLQISINILKKHEIDKKQFLLHARFVTFQGQSSFFIILLAKTKLIQLAIFYVQVEEKDNRVDIEKDTNHKEPSNSNHLKLKNNKHPKIIITPSSSTSSITSTNSQHTLTPMPSSTNSSRPKLKVSFGPPPPPASLHHQVTQLPFKNDERPHKNNA